MDEMTDDELSLALAERLEPKPTTLPDDAFDRYLVGEAIESPLGFWRVVSEYEAGDVPEWIPMPLASNLIHAATVEARIKEMGLQHEYIPALVDLVSAGLWDAPTLDLFAVATATPRARCQAALLAIGHAQEKK